MSKKKKIIILLLLIILIMITVIVFMFSSKQKENEIEKIPTLQLTQVMDIENIEKSKYEIKKNEKIQVSSKYTIMDKIYEIKANIELEETLGKIIYIREDYEKINIYQTEYEIDKYEDKNHQIEEIINEFEEICKRYLNLYDEEPINEILYGDNDKYNKPIAESIYNDNRLYSISYKCEEKTYDINFYRNGENIICELAYIMS